MLSVASRIGTNLSYRSKQLDDLLKEEVPGISELEARGVSPAKTYAEIIERQRSFLQEEANGLTTNRGNCSELFKAIREDAHLHRLVERFWISEVKVGDERIEALESELRKDDRTSLLNHKTFTEEAVHMISLPEHRISNRPFSFYLFLDCRNFGEINKLFGHHTGDQVIKKVSQQIASRVRAWEDLICGRFAGDEFEILARGLESREAIMGFASRFMTFLDRVDWRKIIGPSRTAEIPDLRADIGLVFWETLPKGCPLSTAEDYYKLIHEKADSLQKVSKNQPEPTIYMQEIVLSDGQISLFGSLFSPIQSQPTT